MTVSTSNSATHPAACIAYIGMGANLNNPCAQILRAMDICKNHPDFLYLKASSLYRSAPVDASHQPDYVNAVLALKTLLPPLMLLQKLQKIEQDFGRKRAFFNAPRTLDLDLLLYGNLCVCEENLIIPHPRMTQRAFVLLPLLEIHPAITLPNGRAAQSFLSALGHQRIEKIPV